jgi:hypothetical protein
MGMKELIASTDQSVISVFSCCDHVPVYEFKDDASPDTPSVQLYAPENEKKGQEHQEPEDPEDFPNDCHAAQENFFFRMTLPTFNSTRPKKAATAGTKKKGGKGNKALSDVESHHESGFGLPNHCTCDKPYSPSDEIMRYCLDCTKWFHERCLTESDQTDIEVAIAGDEPPPLGLTELATLPIIRGEEWGIGGNINLVAKAREYLAEGRFDGWDQPEGLGQHGLHEWHEWRDMMEHIRLKDDSSKDNDGYGKQMETKYVCPSCDKTI